MMSRNSIRPVICDDGFYCLCFKSENPTNEQYNHIFRKYGMFTRCDTRGGVVYVRTESESEAQRCIDDLGDTYNFRIITNSRKSKPESAQLNTSFNHNVSTTQPSESTYKVLSAKASKVYHVIFANLPSECSPEDVYDLCAEAVVAPALIQMETTNNQKLPFTSVYVKNEDDIRKLCEYYSNFMMEDKKLLVTSADSLITEAV